MTSSKREHESDGDDTTNKRSRTDEVTDESAENESSTKTAPPEKAATYASPQNPYTIVTPIGEISVWSFDEWNAFLSDSNVNLEDLCFVMPDGSTKRIASHPPTPDNPASEAHVVKFKALLEKSADDLFQNIQGDIVKGCSISDLAWCLDPAEYQHCFPALLSESGRIRQAPYKGFLVRGSDGKFAAHKGNTIIEPDDILAYQNFRAEGFTKAAKHTAQFLQIKGAGTKSGPKSKGKGREIGRPKGMTQFFQEVGISEKTHNNLSLPEVQQMLQASDTMLGALAERLRRELGLHTSIITSSQRRLDHFVCLLLHLLDHLKGAAPASPASLQLAFVPLAGAHVCQCRICEPKLFALRLAGYSSIVDGITTGDRQYVDGELALRRVKGYKEKEEWLLNGIEEIGHRFHEHLETEDDIDEQRQRATTAQTTFESRLLAVDDWFSNDTDTTEAALAFKELNGPNQQLPGQSLFQSFRDLITPGPNRFSAMTLIKEVKTIQANRAGTGSRGWIPYEELPVSIRQHITRSEYFQVDPARLGQTPAHESQQLKLETEDAYNSHVQKMEREMKDVLNSVEVQLEGLPLSIEKTVWSADVQWTVKPMTFASQAWFDYTRRQTLNAIKVHSKDPAEREFGAHRQKLLDDERKMLPRSDTPLYKGPSPAHYGFDAEAIAQTKEIHAAVDPDGKYADPNWAWVQRVDGGTIDGVVTL